MKKQKSLPKLKKELWKWFSLYIKLKHSDNGEICKCFTCDKPLKIGTSDCQGGHYYSKGGFPGLYFNELNVAPQCYHCNINLSGNTQIFREKLIQKYGESAVEELDRIRHISTGWKRWDYMEKIEHYKTEVKKLNGGLDKAA